MARAAKVGSLCARGHVPASSREAALGALASECQREPCMPHKLAARTYTVVSNYGNTMPLMKGGFHG